MVFFIAEIGSNWCGDIDLAKNTIKACKEAGADAVKFQMWRSRDLYKEDYSKYELTFEKAEKIKEYCDSIGIEFFCSVFYPEAVDFLEKLGVKRYKLATRTMSGKDPYKYEIVKKVLETRKPIITSNGDLLSAKDLYCIPDYPTNPDKIDWEEALSCDGFSDHTLGIESALKYARLKPDGIIEKHVKLKENYPGKILEKHVKLDNSCTSPDSFFSITTQELATLITLSTSESDKLG